MNRGSGRLSGRLWRVEWIVWALIVAYVLFFGAFTVLKHDAFQTTAFDLGNVDQAVWNTRHGRPFAMTNIEGLSNRLGTHVEPILLLVSLLYYLWSDPRALLLLQTVAIALGAWPVYLLAARALQTEPPEPFDSRSMRTVLPVLFSAVYLLFPALQSANVFDFHALALAPPLFLFAFYCLETERWGWYALFAVLAMGCKEDMPLLVAMLGLYALIVRRKWIAGVVTITVAGVWFLLAVGWIMPHFDTRGVSPLANRYAHLGDSPMQMVATILTRPGIVLDQLLAAGGLTYVRDLLAPIAFLPLLAPQVLMMALPPLLVNLLSSDGFMHQLEGFHYGVTLVPVVVVSAAYGVGWLLNRMPRFRMLPLLLIAAILGTSLFYHVEHGFTPLAADFSGSWPVVTEHQRLGEAIARGIPTEASLAALPYPNPHASQRQQLSMIDRIEDRIPAPLSDAELVWLDVTDSWPLHPNDLRSGVENLLTSGYGIQEANDGWLLLQRGGSQVDIPDSFFDFARAPESQPQYAMQIQFLLDGEPVLESLGFDLHSESRGEIHHLTFYWRALQSLPPELRLYPFYLDDASGQILEDTSLRPMVATIWYPPEQWQAGEVIATSTMPWRIGSMFSIGLGVVQGDDWNAVDRRLPIRVESSDLVVRLLDGGTWAHLLRVEDGQPVEQVRQFDVPSKMIRTNADLDGKVRLVGYDIECSRSHTSCDVQLFWQAQSSLSTSYTSFAQLLDPMGQVRAQVDTVPQGGGYPTIWWLPGEVVADSLLLSLSPDAPRDVSYRLIVGMYEASSGTRLQVNGTGADFVDLGTIEP